MKKKAKIIILTTITILWMVFIFIMSAKNATQSSSISGGFTTTSGRKPRSGKWRA